MANELDASPELMDLVFFALDHAIASVKDSGGPLTPFLVVQAGSDRTLKRFLSETLEDSLKQARKAASELGPEVLRCALAHDGFVTIDEKKVDAIIVQATERGRHDSVKFIQRYRHKGWLRPFAAVGNAAYCGTSESLMTGP